MNFIENKNTEYKSIRKVIGNRANHTDLAEECVAFANAQGGCFIVGVEDNCTEPPADQHIDQSIVNSTLARLRSLTDSVGITNGEIVKHENGGEYFTFTVMPTTRTIATTSSGKVFMRQEDRCIPISGEALTTLAAEKNAFQWELVSTKVNINSADRIAVDSFIADIKSSAKVSDFIKTKDSLDLLRYYQLIDDKDMLTNLGTLWLGTPTQRARVSYPITAQYIVYNSSGEKIRKTEWHYHQHSPKDLLMEIIKEAVELTYTTELSKGLFRKNYLNYPTEVVRELLVNAVAHKKYTISGDIFIEVYPDRLVITSPGGFPLGITANNILHQTHRRNPHLILTLHDLGVMEGEGSGYDLVYEKLARLAKPMPLIDNEINKVSITILSQAANEDTLSILDYISNYFMLTQKEYITLGLIAAEKKIPTTLLFDKLQLNSQDKLRSWIGTLVSQGIVIARGVKKGTEYLLNPSLLANAHLNITPTLKTIEPHRLEALIFEDVRLNGNSKISEITERIIDVPAKDIQKAVYRLKTKGEFTALGGNRNKRYAVSKKK